MSSKRPMCEAIPKIVARVDNMQAVFGEKTINRLIRAFVSVGVPGFYACDTVRRVAAIECSTDVAISHNVIHLDTVISLYHYLSQRHF